MSSCEDTPRIGSTSAIEQHLQTVLTALLTAGIIASVGFAWRAQSTIDAIAVRQIEHIKVTDRMLTDIRELDRRVDSAEGRLARIEAQRDIDRHGRNGKPKEQP